MWLNKFDAFFLLIEVIIASSALMLGVLFLTAKGTNKKANIFLSLFLWGLATILFYGIIDFFHEINLQNPPDFLFEPSVFIIVFLFLYIEITLNKVFKKSHLWLFLPGLIIHLFMWFFEDYDWYEYFDLFFIFFVLLFNIALMVWVFKILKQHKKKLSNFYSEIENKTLWWIRSIVVAVLSLHFIFIIGEFLEEENASIVFFIIENILTLFIVFRIGHYGFHQSEIFRSGLFLDNPKANAILKSGEIVEKEQRYNQLLLRITEEKLFKDPDLSLHSLAIATQFKERELSSLINMTYGSNFYQFINEFRVTEFKHLLIDPNMKHLSVVGLAHEAGFSSKSTFYSFFKTKEGLTPTAYKNKIESEI